MKPNTTGAFLFRYRGIIPAIILALTLTFHFIQLTTIGQQSFTLTNTYYLTVLTFAVVGLIYRAVTIGQSPKGTSGRNTSGQLATVLNTTGMYSVSRNPLYFGNFIIWTSIVLLTGNMIVLLFFILFFMPFYSFIIREEARFLASEFGAFYDTWMSHTPAFFPNPVKYRKSENQFNWMKIIRKEKNGIAAVMVSFCVFRLVIPIQVLDVSFTEAMRIEWPWVLVGCAGITYYLIVKSLVRRTSLLDNNLNRIASK